jgi:two-component system chemotaxis response regulator CheB
MLEMKQAGARTVAEGEAARMVFCMPKEAIKLGGVNWARPMQAMAAAIL